MMSYNRFFIFEVFSKIQPRHFYNYYFPPRHQSIFVISRRATIIITIMAAGLHKDEFYSCIGRLRHGPNSIIFPICLKWQNCSEQWIVTRTQFGNPRARLPVIPCSWAHGSRGSAGFHGSHGVYTWLIYVCNSTCIKIHENICF